MLFRYKGSDESLYERTFTGNKLTYASTKHDILEKHYSEDTLIDDIKVDF